jgi:hypothetical protein
MLKIFTAALLATALIAGPAFAAPSADANATTATAPAAAGTAKTGATAPLKTVKPALKSTTKHIRKHLARGKLGDTHQVQHIKSAKTHQASVAKPVKTGDKAAM